MTNAPRKALHLAAMAILLSGTATVTTFVTAEPAFAERGGNGNGNGNARGRDRDRERPSANRSNGNRGNGNGNGAIASELKWLNAANANQNALENASPNSRPGQLFIFQNDYVAAQEAITAAEDAVTTAEGDLLLAQANLAALQDAGEEGFVSPDGVQTYADAEAAALQAVADATAALGGAEANLTEAEGAVDDAILTLTGGRELSEGALAELLSRLGL